MQLKILFLLTVTTITTNCSTNKQLFNNKGVILNIIRVYDTITSKYVEPIPIKDTKLWIKDSLVIKEIIGINCKTELNGKTTCETYTDKYLFIDLKHDVYYEYKNFSDTAKVLYAYDRNTKGRPSTVWDLKGESTSFKTNNLKQKSDTSIEGINFQRFTWSSMQKYYFDKFPNVKDSTETMSYYTGFIRSDYKNFLVCFEKKLSEKLGKPLVGYHVYTPYFKSNWLFLQEPLTNKLTKEEMKVFEAWEKNETLFPVKE